MDVTNRTSPFHPVFPITTLLGYLADPTLKDGVKTVSPGGLCSNVAFPNSPVLSAVLSRPFFKQSLSLLVVISGHTEKKHETREREKQRNDCEYEQSRGKH